MHGVAQSNMPENPTPNRFVFTVYQKFKILNSFFVEIPGWAILPNHWGICRTEYPKEGSSSGRRKLQYSQHSLGALNACMFD
jgi:hypothetical protein